MKNYYVVLCFLTLGFLFTEINAQQSYTVKRGERPSIDLQALPVDTYEKGILKIKLDESFTNQMDNNSVIVDKNGTVRFNISNIDQLNQQYGAKNFKKLFECKAFSPKFSERHRAWGFHLWYTLYFDEKTDIKKLITAYENLAEVTIAEPEYKKEIIASEPISSQTKIMGDDPVSPPVDWTPDDPSYNLQWHYHNTGQQSGTPDADIDLPEAWDIEKGNSSVIVCIEDGGVQYDHPDLSDNMWSGLGWDFVNNDATIEPHYHGTHVAGTVAAETNNGTGVSGVAGGSGENDGVRLMSCQVFEGASSGGFHLAPIYAADNGACISQNSWTYTSPDSYDQSVLDAIDYFNANGGGSAMLNGGITIYAAANYNSSSHYYPAYYSGTFSVAATNNQDIKSYYSNYGTWVDISAPGGETNSVTARGVYSTDIGSSYQFLQGTSMACPHTSGVAGLIVSLAYGILTPTDVANIISSTTDDHYGVNLGYIGQLGTGRLNAYQALLETQNYMSGVLNPQTFTATPVSSSQINLAWTKNTSNNDVMVVWSLSSTIGAPVDGVTYTAGQTIPGGGTVLYRGSNTSYNHISLNAATTYFYKAFSYNAGNEYSSGKSANATTFCDAISSLPFTEDFSGGTLPVCWENIDNVGNGQIWQFNNPGGRTISTSSAGNGFAILDSDNYGSGDNQDADLVTPLLDLSGYSTVNLYFEHYFMSYSGSSATLSYSINGGTSWFTIQTWTSSTSNPATFNQDLTSQVAGQLNVKFRWKYVGSYGWYWAVDDISITGAAPGLWTGTTSTDWGTTTNWDDGNIPVASTDVIIPTSPTGGNFPETNTGGGAVCNNLTIESGARLNIPSNNTLTVNGTLTNNAGVSGLVIKSTANNATGSLIHSTGGVNATVEKYLTDMQWHFIGIPVEGEFAGVFHLPGGHSDIYLRTHIEATNTWGVYIVPVTTPLALGRGYETWVGDRAGFHQPETIKFTGLLNTGDHTTGSGGFYGLEYTSGRGLNLISNPYPSALEADIDIWTKTNIDNSVWIWDDASGNYVYWNGTD
ncbi:MAG: S8 family serine peptidase, partial [Bacteroidales bacterium]|nr:S8 family serine peptidase [Bacteroidales bacterium]